MATRSVDEEGWLCGCAHRCLGIDSAGGLERIADGIMVGPNTVVGVRPVYKTADRAIVKEQMVEIRCDECDGG